MRQCASNSANPRGTYEIFISRIQSLQKIYAQAGYFIRALSPNPNAKDIFLALPTAKQIQINQKLGSDLEFYFECLEKKQPLNDVKRLVELIAQQRKMNIPAGAMEKIQPNSLVEIYDLDLIQLYRSANFFSYTSHSLEDLESRPYFELFKKSEQVEREIDRFVNRVLSGRQRTPDFTTLGTHRLWEINSRKKIVTQNQTEVLSPIFQAENGALSGVIHVCTVLSQTEFSLVRVDDPPLSPAREISPSDSTQ